MQVITGNKEFFKNLPQVKYEGIESDNPLAFRRGHGLKKLS